MRIKVNRYKSNNKATLSKIYLDGVFFCFGVEDQYQKVKIMHETRIPAGTYNIKLRKTGGLNSKYASKYDFHKGMLHIQNVPGFTNIYIHIGNTDDHTSGCLIVGRERDEDKLTVSFSKYAYSKLYKAVTDAVISGYLDISFEDNDRIPSLQEEPESLTSSQASHLYSKGTK